VAGILSDLGNERTFPKRISVDNGTEFTSKALDHWAYWNKVELDFSRTAVNVTGDLTAAAVIERSEYEMPCAEAARDSREAAENLPSPSGCRRGLPIS